MYPYLYIHNGTLKPKEVTFLVNVPNTNFGYGKNLQTDEQVISYHYMNTVYYYIVLGTNFTIGRNDQVNNNILIAINTLTGGLIFIIPLCIVVLRKKLRYTIK